MVIGPQLMLRDNFNIAKPCAGEIAPMPERSMRASVLALCAAIPIEDQAPHCKLHPTRNGHYRRLRLQEMPLHT